MRRPLILAAALLAASCKKSYAVGDHVYVDWDGSNYPAMILEAPGPAKFKVHFDGYDTIWDETVSRDRIRGPVEGTPVHPDPPAKVRAKALAAAKTNIYKIQNRVRVEWHGQIYPSTITGIVGPEKYRVHFDGYGNEWDVIVGLSKIQPK